MSKLFSSFVFVPNFMPAFTYIHTQHIFITSARRPISYASGLNTVTQLM